MLRANYINGKSKKLTIIHLTLRKNYHMIIQYIWKDSIGYKKNIKKYLRI